MCRILIAVLIGLSLSSCSASVNPPLFEFISESHPKLTVVFNDPELFEVQIRYTQINRNKWNEPSFRTITYRCDSTKYFYPASTVKMPVAFMALEKLNEINHFIHNEGVLDRKTTMLNDKEYDHQTSTLLDSLSCEKFPSISQYINQIFVASDNNVFNRLYEFIGQNYLNQKLRSKGIFTNSRIVHRLAIPELSTIENGYTNRIRFLDDKNKMIYSQEGNFAEGDYYDQLKNTKKGQGFYDDFRDGTIMQPFNMAEKNFISLKDLENSLMKVVFESSFSKESKFDLDKDQYDFLYQSMLKLPKDYECLKLDSLDNDYDSYVKFFIYGDSQQPIPEYLKIMNKVGYAYGYVTDCAFIFDLQKNIEFLLTASIHVNKNRIYDDGVYEYEEVGIPFLAELGRQIYDYELRRARIHVPDFAKYKV